MNILFLSSWFPYPPINGAKIRIYNLLHELAQNHDITLIAFARSIPVEDAKAHLSFLEEFCKSVDVVPAEQFEPSSFAAFKGFVSSMPRSVTQTYSLEMENLISERVAANQFDVVIASEVGAPGTVSLLASKIEGIPKILDALEIGLFKDAYNNQTVLHDRLRNGLTWFKQRNFTKRMLRQTDGCTVPSVEEQQHLLEIVGDPALIKVVPHGLDLTYYAEAYAPPKPGSMIFTGSFSHFPNADAALYFLEEIYPLIKMSAPDANIQVVGSTDGVDLGNLAADKSIHFTGLLKDVRPVVAESWLSVVPLRLGAGTRLKIIESMALGTPVISTSKGAEGLSVTHGKNILIADEPKEFARAVVQAIKNPDLRWKLSNQGRKLVSDKYSSEVMGRDVDSLMRQIVEANGATVQTQ